MLVQVKLLRGFSESLTYSVPEEWDSSNLLGALVEVPFRQKTVSALITEILTQNISVNFKIKTIIKIYAFPQDKLFYKFIEQASKYYVLEPIYWFKRIRQFLGTDKQFEDDIINLENNIINNNSEISLTSQQKYIVDNLYIALDNNLYYPSLLYGVTGSGKTEIYKKIIEKAISQNKSVIFLLPEVTLAVQFAAIFKEKLLNIDIFSFHSAVGQKEKKLSGPV